jgi:hypothetical protein
MTTSTVDRPLRGGPAALAVRVLAATGLLFTMGSAHAIPPPHDMGPPRAGEVSVSAKDDGRFVRSPEGQKRYIPNYCSTVRDYYEFAHDEYLEVETESDKSFWSREMANTIKAAQQHGCGLT